MCMYICILSCCSVRDYMLSVCWLNGDFSLVVCVLVFREQLIIVACNNYSHISAMYINSRYGFPVQS